MVCVIYACTTEALFNVDPNINVLCILISCLSSVELMFVWAVSVMSGNKASENTTDVSVND